MHTDTIVLIAFSYAYDSIYSGSCFLECAVALHMLQGPSVRKNLSFSRELTVVSAVSFDFLLFDSMIMPIAVNLSLLHISYPK